MFEVISHIPGDTRVAAQKAGTPSSASVALYDQILRSVLREMESALAAPAAPDPTSPADEAPMHGMRTLEDVMMQRQFVCTLNDIDAALPLEELALQQQLLAPRGAAENAASNPLLQESLAPWELLMGRLALQQRLAR
ncbi:hypothetical protein F7R01_12490 [Pseudomonas argentinensis]|uniref:Uncharacterized protein n=1 Tax=Phytopseudomonas argentinensis TaxID=289370 RepID=A0A1I3HM26_9GAMM|nr:hypothetical protein [Pseudomonas argentinensis]KAB0548288.1 hypothetical protein F7R01_12490 [Pseudomonas argentinensis]SFI36828.1 hypothetical protein SAMN05216602_1019 [Pseudomonas argentinensis]